MKGPNNFWRNEEEERWKKFEAMLQNLIIILLAVLVFAYSYKHSLAENIARQEREWNKAKAQINSVEQQMFEDSFIFGEICGLIVLTEDTLHREGTVTNVQNNEFWRVYENFYENNFSEQGFSEFVTYCSEIQCLNKINKFLNDMDLQFVEGCDRKTFLLGQDVQILKAVISESYTKGQISEEGYKELEQMYLRIEENPTAQAVFAYVEKAEEILN